MISKTLTEIKREMTQAATMQDASTWNSLLQQIVLLKGLAISDGNEPLAKDLWCMQQVAKIHLEFLLAFAQMKAEEFYQAWCTLERVEIELSFLERHFDISQETFRLVFVKQQTEHFQSLFPYHIFFSPEMIIREKRCTICNSVLTLRSSCGHVTGEIYGGEMRGVRVTGGEFIGMALVKNPVQKYSVAFVNGKDEDNYDYFMVNNVVTRLKSAFDSWEPKWEKRLYPHSAFKGVGRNCLCPCKSGLKYKKCCLQKEGVLIDHCHVIFNEVSAIDVLRE